MLGLVADVNLEGHFVDLLRLLTDDVRREFWVTTQSRAETFTSLCLEVTANDRVAWLTCQARNCGLLTANRNRLGPDSLQAVLDELNHDNALPVMTIADATRFRSDREYAVRVADRLLDYLSRIESLRGTGRLFLP